MAQSRGRWPNRRPPRPGYWAVNFPKSLVSTWGKAPATTCQKRKLVRQSKRRSRSRRLQNSAGSDWRSDRIRRQSIRLESRGLHSRILRLMGKPTTLLEDLCGSAGLLGAQSIMVEYKDRRERVFAHKEGMASRSRTTKALTPMRKSYGGISTCQKGQSAP